MKHNTNRLLARLIALLITVGSMTPCTLQTYAADESTQAFGAYDVEILSLLSDRNTLCYEEYRALSAYPVSENEETKHDYSNVCFLLVGGQLSTTVDYSEEKINRNALESVTLLYPLSIRPYLVLNENLDSALDAALDALIQFLATDYGIGSAPPPSISNFILRLAQATLLSGVAQAKMPIPPTLFLRRVLASGRFSASQIRQEVFRRGQRQYPYLTRRCSYFGERRQTIYRAPRTIRLRDPSTGIVQDVRMRPFITRCFDQSHVGIEFRR